MLGVLGAFVYVVFLRALVFLVVGFFSFFGWFFFVVAVFWGFFLRGGGEDTHKQTLFKLDQGIFKGKKIG